MNKSLNGISWAARIMAILFAVFISIFALDVFDEGFGLGKTILALLIHLIPAFIILLILIVSWNKQWIAGISFLLLAIIYISTAWATIKLSGMAIIAIPLFVLSALHFFIWFKKRQ